MLCKKDGISRSSHRRCFVRKVVLEISQNSQESTCATASFLKKLQTYTYEQFLRTPFLQNTSGRLLPNFAKFTEKHLYQNLFFNEVAGQACNFIKKETRAQVFSFEFGKISKHTFYYRTPLVVASARCT